MPLTLLEIAAASVPTPPAGKVTFFLDLATGVPSFKDETGTVTAVTSADAELAAIAGLTSAADRLPYFTGSGTAALATFTAAGRALVDDANAAAQLTTLGVTAAAQTVLDDATTGDMLTTLGAQPLDAELSAIAGLTSAADKVPYFTGAGTAAVADFTAAGRALMDDAAASNQRTTLGLGGAAVLNVGTTAGTVAAGDDSRFSSGSGGGTPGTSVPYMYPFSDAIDWNGNDNFRLGDGAGGMDTAGTRFTSAQAWTARNISGAATLANGRMYLTAPSDTLLQVRGYDTPVPSGNWCIRMNVTFREMITTTTQRYAGLFLRDSTSGKFEIFAIGQAAGTTAAQVIAYKMTDFDTFSATRAGVTVATAGFVFPSFIEIEYDGTNYYCRAGFVDGPLQRFSASHFFAKTDFLTAAADTIGVFASNNQSNPVTLISRGFYRVPVSVGSF